MGLIMPLELTTPPENHYFKIENFGKGWLIMSLRVISTKETVLSSIIPRPVPDLNNLRTTNYDTDSILEVTQTNDIKATAFKLVKDFKELCSNPPRFLEEIEEINQKEYIGNYS